MLHTDHIEVDGWDWIPQQKTSLFINRPERKCGPNSLPLNTIFYTVVR
jgi:hypothetical protein